MKVLVSVVVASLVGSILWGWCVGMQPTPSRVETRAIAVGPEWYESLPTDPAIATAEYLKRVPAESRASGNAFADTRQLVLAERVAVLVASIPIIMLSGTAAVLQQWAQARTRLAPLQDALVALIVFAVLFLLNLPVETYAGYVRLRHAGFSQRPYLDWLGEAALGWAVTTVFYVIGVVAILPLIRRRPQSWAAWATAVYFALSSVYVLISPQVIEPLFNTIRPLAESPEKQAILSLARANGVPVNDVLVRDASKQGKLLNAHVSGIGGSAQIVLDDNTIANTPRAEFELVMAHEIGHYVLGHVPLAIVLDTLVTGLGFLFVGWSASKLLARFGRRWAVGGFGDSATMPVLWGLLSLWGFLSLPIANSISRAQEAQADIFGINASQRPEGLAEFMIRDSDAARLEPSTFEEWLMYDHPSARARIFAAMSWRAEHLRDATR